MPKKLKGGPFSLARYYMLQKRKVFGSVPWVNRYNLDNLVLSFKFCGTSRRTILVTSGVSKNKTRTSKVGAISKAQKVFKTCPGRIFEKLRKQFRNTQRVPFMLEQNRKPLFPQLGKNIFLKKTSDFVFDRANLNETKV